jgi:prophage antirepressor-like protein
MAAEIIRQEAFEDMQLAVIEHEGEEWFSAEDIGEALGFSDPRPSIIRIFNRNKKEFEGLSTVVTMTTIKKAGGTRPYRITIFNLRYHGAEVFNGAFRLPGEWAHLQERK